MKKVVNVLAAFAILVNFSLAQTIGGRCSGTRGRPYGTRSQRTREAGGRGSHRAAWLLTAWAGTGCKTNPFEPRTSFALR
jgi:hypothetical protein